LSGLERFPSRRLGGEEKRSKHHYAGHAGGRGESYIPSAGADGEGATGERSPSLTARGGEGKGGEEDELAADSVSSLSLSSVEAKRPGGTHLSRKGKRSAFFLSDYATLRREEGKAGPLVCRAITHEERYGEEKKRKRKKECMRAGAAVIASCFRSEGGGGKEGG